MPAVRQASYDIVNTAAIDESPTTIGIAESNLYSMSNAEIDKALDKMLSLGVTNVRVGVFWLNIQPTSATKYNWAKTDYIVKAASDRGMGILGVLNKTPPWAGSLGNGHPDPDTYAKFAATVAERYAGQISAYEIWNEPNGFLEWNPVSAASYTEMLKKAYTAIKTVAASTNQDIKVIGGVVGAGLTLGNLTLDPVSFVTQMYANGAQGYFDAISFHPYNYSVKFSAGPANTWPGTSALAQLQAIRALMNVKGDADLKIWISEYGQPTVSGTAADLQKQADFMEDMIRSWQKFLNGGPIFIYNVKDTGPANSTNTEHHFGLFDYSWNEKAAADVIRKLILELTGPKPTNPTTPKPQTGLAAFAHQLASMVATIINFVPKTAMAMMKAVQNLLGGIFGTAKVATAAARVAAAGSEADTTTSVTAESVEKAPDVGESASTQKATTGKHDTTTATETLADTKTEEKPASTDVDSEAASTTADPVAEVDVTTEAVTEVTDVATEVTEVATETKTSTTTAPETSTATESATETNTGTAAVSDPKTAAEPDAKPDTKPDTKSDSKSGTKTDTKTETETKSETKTEATSTAGSSPKTDDTKGDKVTRPGAKSGLGVKGTNPKKAVKPKPAPKPRTPEPATTAASQESRVNAGAGGSSGKGDASSGKSDSE
ncbi:cellulase family glycosylhydrolase [Mycolicibacterium sp. Y3]